LVIFFRENTTYKIISKKEKVKRKKEKGIIELTPYFSKVVSGWPEFEKPFKRLNYILSHL